MLKTIENEYLKERLQELIYGIEIKANEPIYIYTSSQTRNKLMTLMVKKDCLIITTGRGDFKQKYRIDKSFLQ